MLAARDVLGEEQAADAHAAHERAEQHAERNGGRSDDEAQELEPDDLIDERGASAADEEQDEKREEPVLDR